MEHYFNESDDEMLCEALDNIEKNLYVLMRPEDDAVLCDLLDKIESDLVQNNQSVVESEASKTLSDVPVAMQNDSDESVIEQNETIAIELMGWMPTLGDIPVAMQNDCDAHDRIIAHSSTNVMDPMDWMPTLDDVVRMEVDDDTVEPMDWLTTPGDVKPIEVDGEDAGIGRQSPISEYAPINEIDHFLETIDQERVYSAEDQAAMNEIVRELDTTPPQMN